jgi:hypothetical protein
LPFCHTFVRQPANGLQKDSYWTATGQLLDVKQFYRYYLLFL